MVNQNTENLLKNFEESFQAQDFDKAATYAENGDFIEKQIQVYDAMIEYQGRIKPDAGNIMFKAGLLGKAKKYFEAYGEYSSPLYKDIEQIVSESPDEFKRNLIAMIECTKQPEENPFTWELIYNVKQGNLDVIHDLEKGISLKESIEDEYSRPDIKN